MIGRIRLAVVDDHPLMRRGIELTLDHEADFEVVEGGSCADDAVRIARDLAPNLMLIDVNMPGGGLAATREICAKHPAVQILILTVSEEHDNAAAALEAGARGYILKGISGPEFVRTIRTVVAGETYVTPSFAARLLSLSARKNRADAAEPALKNPLSAREQQVLVELSLGLTNKEIAKNLALTEQTIKHYISGVLQKFKVRNRVEAVLSYKRLKNGGA